jgi:hypothetical protein
MSLNSLSRFEIKNYLTLPGTLILFVNYRFGTKFTSSKYHNNSNMRYFSCLL